MALTVVRAQQVAAAFVVQLKDASFSRNIITKSVSPLYVFPLVPSFVYQLEPSMHSTLAKQQCVCVCAVIWHSFDHMVSCLHCL